jgi:carbamate kinase
MKQAKESILVALGGNALHVDESGSNLSPQEEFIVAHKGLKNIIDLIEKGHDRLVITHGNGPQVGRIFLQQELTKKDFPRQTTLDVCVADTQGRIGYTLQNVFNNECKSRGIEKLAYTGHPGFWWTIKIQHSRIRPNLWANSEEEASLCLTKG